MDNKKQNNNENNELTKRQKIFGIIGICIILILSLITRFKNNNLNIEQKKDLKTKTNNINEIKNEESKKEYEKIIAGNYSITFKINDNDIEETGIIKYNADRVLLIVNKKEVYRGEIEKINYKYFKYLNFSKINKLMSMTIEKEQLESLNKYKISTIDLFDLYNSDFVYDSFKEYADDSLEEYFIDGYLSRIVIDYSNYYKYINNSNTKLTIDITYDDFGNVGNI